MYARPILPARERDGSERIAGNGWVIQKRIGELLCEQRNVLGMYTQGDCEKQDGRELTHQSFTTVITLENTWFVSTSLTMQT